MLVAVQHLTNFFNNLACGFFLHPGASVTLSAYSNADHYISNWVHLGPQVHRRVKQVFFEIEA